MLRSYYGVKTPHPPLQGVQVAAGLALVRLAQAVQAGELLLTQHPALRQVEDGGGRGREQELGAQRVVHQRRGGVAEDLGLQVHGDTKRIEGGQAGDADHDSQHLQVGPAQSMEGGA